MASIELVIKFGSGLSHARANRGASVARRCAAAGCHNAVERIGVIERLGAGGVLGFKFA